MAVGWGGCLIRIITCPHLYPHQEPTVCREGCKLPALEEVDLELTAQQVFGWLKIN